MTTTPTPADGRRSAPGVDLLDVRWRRIQVLLRFARSPSLPDPATLRLRYEGTGASIAPVGWEPEDVDGELTVRFNVMLGPDSMPLTTGRWVLVTAGGSSRGRHDQPVTIARAPQALPTATFELAERTLVFRPSLTGTVIRSGFERERRR